MGRQGQEVAARPAHAVVRDADSRFGDGWLAWEPETTVDAWREHFGAAPTDIEANQLFAVQTLRANPAAFYGDFAIFENVVLALNGAAPAYDELQVALPEELEAAFAELELFAFPAGSFAPDVVAYVRAACADAGCYAYPPRLAARFEPAERRKIGDAVRAKAADPAFDLDAAAASSDLTVVQAAKLRRIALYVAAVVAEPT